MSENALIGYVNRFETGTVGANTAERSRPASDIATSSGGDYWQTPAGTTSAWITVNARAMVDWRVFGVFRTNLTTSALWRIQLGAFEGDNSLYDSGSVAAGVQAGYGQALHVLDSPIAAQWLRIDLIDPTNPDDFLRVGLAFGGDVWQPSRNFSYGWSIGWEDPTEMDETIGGQELPRLGRPRRRVLELAFDHIDHNDVRGRLLEIDRRRGRTENVLVVPRPDQPATILNRETVFGRIADNARPTNTAHQLWAKRYRVRERL